MLRRQFTSGYFFEKTIVHCLIFREDNSPVLRRQLYSAQFMVKITVFREDNQPVLHLQRRQSASASHVEKTILPVLKKTILLEKTILLFPELNGFCVFLPLFTVEPDSFLYKSKFSEQLNRNLE